MIHDTHTFVHICTLEEWLTARQIGEYRPSTLDEVGFIHLSAPQQAHLPANRLFAGRRDLVLLRIDPARVGSPIEWEPGVPTDPESMLFPHLYGPLPVGAVTAVVEFQPGPDGTFAPLDPEGLRTSTLPCLPCHDRGLNPGSHTEFGEHP